MRQHFCVLRWGGPIHREGVAPVDELELDPLLVRLLPVQRCLVPVSGVYLDARAGRAPWAVRPRDRGLLAMAGLWRARRIRGTVQSPRDHYVRSFAVVTCPAGPRVAAVEATMPVLLPTTACGAWLDPRADVPTLRTQLGPVADALIDLHRIDPQVYSGARDHAGLLEPFDVG